MSDAYVDRKSESPNDNTNESQNWSRKDGPALNSVKNPQCDQGCNEGQRPKYIDIGVVFLVLTVKVGDEVAAENNDNG